MNVNIPNVSLGEYGYEGTIHLTSWNGFVSSSKGVYRLDIGGDMVQKDPHLSNEHLVAYQYTVDYQNEIRDRIIEALFKIYSDLHADYGYEGDEKLEYMPDVEAYEDFKRLIGLSQVHIMNVYKDGMAYVGYELNCTWDEEHGLGIMMYKDRIVELGSADTSFLTWIAEKDLAK
ncbi:hypothetical protein [Desulfosporosinus sp.]|uniref:DUF6985 domain-containing protein n=1 Tax=Desulfosporosinus sp. TaxID=157907 RepID=UPI0025BC4378|nr:hypothetical protein [Desulfosporosinus sp.]